MEVRLGERVRRERVGGAREELGESEGWRLGRELT